jgi:acyl carrier protein
VRAYLHHWLHHHHYPHEPQQLLAGTNPSHQLKLDALGWVELLADTAEFYGVSIPLQGLEGPPTLENVEAYVQQQLLKSAA